MIIYDSLRWDIPAPSVGMSRMGEVISDWILTDERRYPSHAPDVDRLAQIAHKYRPFDMVVLDLESIRSDAVKEFPDASQDEIDEIADQADATYYKVFKKVCPLTTVLAYMRPTMDHSDGFFMTRYPKAGRDVEWFFKSLDSRIKGKMGPLHLCTSPVIMTAAEHRMLDVGMWRDIVFRLLEYSAESLTVWYRVGMAKRAPMVGALEHYEVLRDACALLKYEVKDVQPGIDPV